MKRITTIIIVILVIWNVLLTAMMLEQKDQTPKIEHTTNEFTVSGYTTDLTKVIDASKSKMVKVQDDQGSHSGIIYAKHNEGIVVVTALSAINLEAAITVTFDNQKISNATLIGYDELSNICVLMTQPDFEVEPFNHASSTLIKQGEFAIALGANLTMTSEVVVAIGFITQSLNYSENQAYTKASLLIQEASLGGAVVNMGGDLMGLSNQLSTGQSASFLTIDELNLITSKILNRELIIRQALGLELIEVAKMTNYQKSALNIALSQQSGLYINEIKEDSIASKNSFIKGMIITAINKQEMTNIFDYHNLIYSLQTEVVIDGLNGLDNFTLNLVLND